MKLDLLKINPQNRGKRKYQFILRTIEDFLKKIIVTFLIIAVYPFLIIKIFRKNRFYIQDFFNQNASVYLIKSLLNIKSSVILFKIKDSQKIISRFGFFFFIKNFAPTSYCTHNTSISFEKKNKPDIYLNSDYFKFFDKKIKENSKLMIMPFYLPKKFYINNLEEQVSRLRNNKKKFKIIFSGSAHSDWYEQFSFAINNKKILNRMEIIKFIKKKYSTQILIVKSRKDFLKINNTKKKIIFIISNPHKRSSKHKILSHSEHLSLISQSEFFLCMPGTSMPICYHLIESLLVGTIPILSYPNLVYPKLSNKNSIIFSNKKNLSLAINKALYMGKIQYEKIRTNVINYYENYVSSESFTKKFLKKKLPLEIFINFDHWSFDQKRIREGLPSLFQ